VHRGNLVGGLWIATLGGMSAVRALVLWHTRALLAQLESSLTLSALAVYVALLLCCAVALLVSSMGIALRRRWGRIVGCASIVGYYVLAQGYVWFFVQSGLMWERRWVSLIVSVLATGLSVTTLSWRVPRRWLGFS